MIRELYTHRELIFTLVKRDLKVRYKASTLGFLWSFGKPLFLMIIMWAIFSQITKLETDIPYTLHLLTGLLPWMYLQAGLFEAMNSIVTNSNVVKKVYLPRGVFPVAAILSNLVHFILALIVLGCLVLGMAVMSNSQVLPNWEIVFLPFVMLLQTIMLLGLAFILSSLNVFYRDVSSITEIFITGWFYLTPVIYPMQLVRDHFTEGENARHWLYYLYLCNPMTPIVVAYRRVSYGRYLSKAPEVSDGTLLLGLGVSTVFALTVFFYGAWLFSRRSVDFADEL